MLCTVMENSTNASVMVLTTSTEDWMNASTGMEVLTATSVFRSYDGKLELYLTLFYLMTVLLLAIVCKYQINEYQ